MVFLVSARVNWQNTHQGSVILTLILCNPNTLNVRGLPHLHCLTTNNIPCLSGVCHLVVVVITGGETTQTIGNCALKVSTSLFC